MRKSPAVIFLGIFLIVLASTGVLVFKYWQLKKQVSTEEAQRQSGSAGETQLENKNLKVSAGEDFYLNASISEFRSETEVQVEGGDTEAIFREGEISEVVEAGKKYQVLLDSETYTVIIATNAFVLEVVSEKNEKGEVVKRLYNPINPDQLKEKAIVGSNILIKYHKEGLQESGGTKTITAEEFDVIK